MLDDFTPGSFVQVELSMRKVGVPGVIIGWELILVDQAEQLEATSKLQNC